VDDPQPLENYLSLVGKFRHLDEDQIAHLKETAATRVELLKGIARARKSPEEIKGEHAAVAV
jgi:hypothetical protein